VRLALAGRELKLVPSYANLAAVEEALDCGFLELAERLSDRSLKITDIARALGIIARPRISQAQAVAAIEEIGLTVAYAKFGEFVVAALFPEAAGQVNGPDDQPESCGPA
jgi:hypothetical protein